MDFDLKFCDMLDMNSTDVQTFFHIFFENILGAQLNSGAPGA